MSWCPDGGSKIAIAYCNLEFQATHPDTTKESYVFNVGKFLSRKFEYFLFCLQKREIKLCVLDDPTEPDLVLQPPHFMVSCEYNQKDPNIIAGGCYNGQVIDYQFQLKFDLILPRPFS